MYISINPTGSDSAAAACKKCWESMSQLWECGTSSRTKKSEYQKLAEYHQPTTLSKMNSLGLYLLLAFSVRHIHDHSYS